MVLPDPRPVVGRGVAVVDAGSKRTTRFGAGKSAEELLQGIQLIAGKGFDRKKIERPPLGVIDQRFGNGHIVYQGLPAGRGGRHNRVPARPDVFQGNRLVIVKREYSEL